MEKVYLKSTFCTTRSRDGVLLCVRSLHPSTRRVFSGEKKTEKKKREKEKNKKQGKQFQNDKMREIPASSFEFSELRVFLYQS